jgi:hypothetical protein
VVNVPSTDSAFIPGSVINAPLKPGITIKNHNPKTILNLAARERGKKRMRVKVRGLYFLKMALTVPKSDRPTEAQIVYALHRYHGEWWLSARAYQVAYPGTTKEAILDITGRIEVEMQNELIKIARVISK